MAEFVKFRSNEDCAKALYQYLIGNRLIAAREPFVQEHNILYDINTQRGHVWLELLPRRAETEGFFAYLDPEYAPHFHWDGAILEDTFIFDISISPGEYWRLATGEDGVAVSSLGALRTMMDGAGLGEVWDYSVSAIHEAVENHEHLVIVEDGETTDYPATSCRVFEVTDEMYARYVKLYGKAHGISVAGPESEPGTLDVDDVLAKAVAAAKEANQGKDVIEKGFVKE